MRAIHAIIAFFLLTAALFAGIHATKTFGDPDAYYHIRMTQLTLESGPVRDFPWLPLTTLADHFADHHFLYHALGAPFVAGLGPFWGMKAATVLFGALAATMFFLLLRAHGVRHAFLWALLPLASAGYLFRLMLSKSVSLSLAGVFLALVLLRRGSRVGLFFLSWAFVWLYGGWPILLLLVAAWEFGRLVFRATGLLQRCKSVWWRELYGPTAAVALGLVAGLVINPFFPDNLGFYREQILEFVVLGRNDPNVQAGNEWLPVEASTLVRENPAVFAVLAAMIAALAYVVRRGDGRDGERPAPERLGDLTTALALASGFFLMALRQARHKEYLVPMAALFAILLADTLLRQRAVQAAFDAARKRLGFCREAERSLRAVFAGLLVAVLLREAAHAHRLYVSRVHWQRLVDVGGWMRTDVPAGELVFHGFWYDFPSLFLYGGDHRYVSGLDPRFFARKNPELHALWQDIAQGRRTEGLAELLRERFGARYVFVRREKDPLKPIIEKDPSFERVYADFEAEVWRIR